MTVTMRRERSKLNEPSVTAWPQRSYAIDDTDSVFNAHCAVGTQHAAFHKNNTQCTSKTFAASPVAHDCGRVRRESDACGAWADGLWRRSPALWCKVKAYAMFIQPLNTDGFVIKSSNR